MTQLESRASTCGLTGWLPIAFFLSTLFLSPSQVHAQQSLAETLATSPLFADKVLAGEAYFRAKRPGIALRSLASGPERDGEFVKFMRWQKFWKERLDPDGTLGDISAHARVSQSRRVSSQASTRLFRSVPWTNLSYENYITQQIGMGRTTSIGFHPTHKNTFYVGAAIGGIWKTTDGGQSYEPLGDELPFLAVSSIIVRSDNPNILYIAVSDHVWYGPPGLGVYRSIDAGKTWQPTALGFDLDDNVRIYWMEADPEAPSKIFVATSAGLYRTDSGFITVVKVNDVNSFDVKINPGNSNIVYLGANNGEFHRSTDGGQTFTLVEDFGSSSVYMAVTPLNAKKVYARHGSSLHKSTDSGQTFTDPPSVFPEQEQPPPVLAFAPEDEQILLAGFFRTHRSDDDGETFYATSDWLADGSATSLGEIGINGLPVIHVDQRNIFHNPLDLDALYYTNDGGVYRYEISSNSFENLSNGLMITQFYDIAVSQTDENIIGGGSQDNGNVFRDTNGIWDDYAPTGDGMNQEIDPTDEDIRYWAYQNGSLQRWTSGVNVGITPPGQLDGQGRGKGAWETPFRLDPSNPGRIIAGYRAVWESLDRGDSWSLVQDFFGGNLEEIAISASNPERIYAAQADKLFVRSDSTNTWNTRNFPSPVSSISDIEVNPSDEDIVYISVPGFAAGSKVYRSVDAGSTWENISGSLPNVSTGAIELYEDIPGAIFVGTDVGVFYRDSLLPEWQPYGELPNTRVEDIEIQYAARLIRVATHGRGVLEAPIVVTACAPGDPDADNDGVCDAYDACASLDNTLIGALCDDGDPSTSGERYSNQCECVGGLPNASYCAASGITGLEFNWIERVSLNGLEQTSGSASYSDFRGIATTLGGGGTYDLEIELESASSSDRVHAWIDLDRDGSFEPAEFIPMSALDDKHVSRGNVVVPSTIGLSPTTMRVRSVVNAPSPDACSAYPGEVEDYTVRFSYCEARGHYGTGSDWIKRVAFNAIDQRSTQSFHSFFREQSTDLARGSSYPIAVTLNYAFDIDAVAVWIDFDRDGVFEDAERTSMSAFPLGADSVSRGIVAVPDEAIPGKTMMRVKSQYSASGVFDACGAAEAGEVEDYPVNIGYCAARGTVGTGSDWINRVTFGALDHRSGKTRYSDFKGVKTDLSRGTTYPIEVSLNHAFAPDRVKVWIDFDKDGVFEASEAAPMSTPTPGANGTATGLVTVPEGAIQGETIMRVRAAYDAQTTAGACGEVAGEVEDYTVNLTYCAASGAPGTTVDWISKVALNAIDNESGKAAYSNFEHLGTTLARGDTHVLEVTINHAFDLDRVYAWVDLDQNGSFTTNERIEMSSLAVGANSTSQGVVQVPGDAPLGKTLVRVRVVYGDGVTADPCKPYFGEVEDYSVEVVPVDVEVPLAGWLHLAVAGLLITLGARARRRVSAAGLSGFNRTDSGRL